MTNKEKIAEGIKQSMDFRIKYQYNSFDDDDWANGARALLMCRYCPIGIERCRGQKCTTYVMKYLSEPEEQND